MASPTFSAARNLIIVSYTELYNLIRRKFRQIQAIPCTVNQVFLSFIIRLSNYRAPFPDRPD